MSSFWFFVSVIMFAWQEDVISSPWKINNILDQFFSIRSKLLPLYPFLKRIFIRLLKYVMFDQIITLYSTLINHKTTRILTEISFCLRCLLLYFYLYKNKKTKYGFYVSGIIQDFLSRIRYSSTFEDVKPQLINQPT